MPNPKKTKEEIIYVYVTKENKLYAHVVGKKRCKSVSNYVDSLITKDRKIHETKAK